MARRWLELRELALAVNAGFSGEIDKVLGKDPPVLGASSRAAEPISVDEVVGLTPEQREEMARLSRSSGA
jgi:hypothetical protein